jgi:hypothetical protein
MTIEEMRKELVKLEELERIADAAELEYDKFPMDKEKEQAFDDAYKNQYDCFMDISIAIVELTRGTVDIANARAMVNGKREQLKRIFNIA